MAVRLQQPVGDLVDAPPAVFDALVEIYEALVRQDEDDAAERRKHDRFARLRN
jgi:hypothetical protein